MELVYTKEKVEKEMSESELLVKRLAEKAQAEIEIKILENRVARHQLSELGFFDKEMIKPKFAPTKRTAAPFSKFNSLVNLLNISDDSQLKSVLKELTTDQLSNPDICAVCGTNRHPIFWKCIRSKVVQPVLKKILQIERSIKNVL